jgi:DNA-directed RNA polymerase specialized sigma24 family protein
METNIGREMKPPDEHARLRRAAAGDQAAWAAILAAHRDRLRRMITMRLDHRLNGRIDPSYVFQEALNSMDPLDREVLVLRHFEELTNGEVAREPHLQESAASKRYIRALHRLQEILASLPGGVEGFRP